VGGDETVYHILSLDGGGLRGVLTAKLLERLETTYPGFLSQVDLFAGTSTGGVLALGLALGRSPKEMGQLYTGAAEKVFADSVWDDIRDLGKLTGADYSNQPLKQAILDLIGEIILGDLPKRVLISSFQLDNDPQTPGVPRMWKPKFFHNFPSPDSDSDEKVVDVALRTGAAPSYFPIYQGYVDGGVVVNNPSMCALAQALHPKTGGQKLQEVTLLSIGTGIVPKYLTEKDADWGLAQWAPHLISIMIEGGVGVADYQCKQILGERYLRIDPVLPANMSMDRLEQLPMLQELGESEDLSAAVNWLKRFYE
jgi:patatin-like phospholipase/acyl hydrolase